MFCRHPATFKMCIAIRAFHYYRSTNTEYVTAQAGCSNAAWMMYTVNVHVVHQSMPYQANDEFCKIILFLSAAVEMIQKPNGEKEGSCTFRN